MSTTTQADIDTMELETSEANENEENEDQNGEIEEVPTEEEKEPDEDDNTSNPEPPPDENKANVKKLFGAANKTAKKISLIGRVPKSCRTFNMELAKALGILGFSNTRWMETCKTSGITPKQVLDRAHFSKTMQINKQRRDEEEEMANNENDGKVKVYGTLKKMSYDDQIRQVHEAYQFLIKKYKLQESVASTSLMIMTLEKEKREAKAAITIQTENKKDEEKKAENNKKVSFDYDADEQKLKRKKSSSLKRTKKTSKNAAASD